MSGGARGTAALGMVILLAAAGCAPNRGAGYEGAVLDARSAVHDGRFDLAATRFDEASRRAKIPRDAVFMRYEAAQARIRAGDVARGASELRAIATAKPPNDSSAEAAFAVAELTRRTNEAEGLAALEDVVTTFPEDGVAQVALAHLLRADDASGPDAAMARLARLAPRVEGKKVAEKFAYERARHLDAAGRTEAARDAYLDVARRWPYPFGGFEDDALFRAADAEEKLGHKAEAIAILERLLAHREVSSFVGSYERPRYLPALLAIARLREETGDRAGARAALHRLYADFTTSTMRDDALWREAELWREDGDQATACARLSTLASDFPDSRYVPCAAAQCPSVKRGAKSKAPATCRAYLERKRPPPPITSEDGGREEQP
ncbi:MAG: hypothetical protein JWP97_1998 [Labilithrix sp.]|nr:hypothetical protein [Labilithrix sp.]